MDSIEKLKNLQNRQFTKCSNNSNVSISIQVARLNEYICKYLFAQPSFKQIHIYISIIVNLKMLQQSHLLRNQPESRKRRLFRFYHAVLEHYSFHPNLYALLLTVQILQITNYGLHESYGPLWNSSFSNGVRLVLVYTDLSPIWRSSPAALLICSSIMVLVNLLALLLVVYEVEKDPKKLEKENIIVIRFITLYALFLKSVLVIPLSYALTVFINASQFGLTFQQQILLTILSILGIALTLANLSMYILFIRQNSPFSKLPFACSVNSRQELNAALKFILGLYGSLIVGKSQIFGQIFSLVYFAMLIFICYYNYTRAGYVQSSFGRKIELGYVIGLWVSQCSFVEILIKQQDTIGFILCIVGLLLLPFLYRAVESKRHSSLIFSNYRNIQSSNKYLLYHYECIKLVNTLENVESLQYLQGILNFHIMHCKKSIEMCVCTRVRSDLLKFRIDKDRENIDVQKRLWFQFIRCIITDIRQKYENTFQFNYLLSYIENDILKNKFRALHSLEQTRQKTRGYKYEFLDYHYVRQVEKKMQVEDRLNNQKKSMDINKYYDFQINFGKLQQMMQESAYMYISFWDLLRSDKATKLSLYESGVKINQKLNDVRECFEKISSINSSNIHALVLYSNFMKVIVNTNEPYQRNQETIEAIKRTMAQTFKFQREVEKEKYGQNSISAIIIISGQRSNIGIIKHCNWKIGEIIGYAPHQLLGQNINVLMPKFIGNMHDDVLRNYLQLSQSQYDFVQRLVPMIDSRNFMVLARMLTKPLPTLFNGLQLVGIFNTVIQNNMNHPGEMPKYVLYRSDTGQVQALSQSCFNEFHYKINKIDEFNEATSELTFSTLFIGAKENDIIDTVGQKCKIYSKILNTSEIQEIAIEVFQRLQIYYYSVKLRLLCFYTQQSYRKMDESFVGKQVKTDQIISNDRQWEKQPKTERSFVQEKAPKQKFLHEMSKKRGFVQNQVLPLKILAICGYIFFVLIVIYCIILIVLHTKSSTVNDFVTLTQLSGQSIGDLCETAYYTRMMHLSYLYPSLGNYSHFQNNVSFSVSSLQNSQFSIQKLYLNYGSNFQSAYEWTISSNGAVTNVSTAIDANIFDLVTAASSFNQVLQKNLNFALTMNPSSSISAPLQQLFTIRFTSLFESIPKKQIYNLHFNSLFNAFISSQMSYGQIQLGIALSILAVFAAIIIPLSLSVLTLIDQTILIFGFMSRHQVEKQIQNCNSFLEIFYQDSYLVWLKKKQKIKQTGVNNLMVDEEMTLKVNPHKDHKEETSRYLQSFASNNPSEAQLAYPSQNIIKNSMNKIQFLEKELHLRTEAEIMVSQTQHQNENQMLRGQIDSSDEDAIYDHLSQDRNSNKLKQFLTYVFLVSAISSYFIFQYFVYKDCQVSLQKQVSNIHLAYLNINALKKIRLYSLEAVIDNTPFQSYPLLTTMANTTYSQLYLAQRKFDEVALGDISEENLYYKNICDSSNIALIKNTLELFPYSSFSSAQCQSLLHQVLLEGLRLGIVGYTETIFNFTKMGNLSFMVNDSYFLQARQMQKYIEAPLRIFQQKHRSRIPTLIGSQIQNLVLLLLGFYVFLGLLWILVWRLNLRGLNNRLRSTREILGFIPVRVFIRNSKLTREYEKYIGELMQ